MPRYIVITPLQHRLGEKPTPPGEPVELDALDGDALVALGALTPAGEDAPAPIAGTAAIGAPGGDWVQLPGGTEPAGQPLSPVAKPLAAMKRPELAIEAAKTNKQVVAAVEAKRAEQA